MTEARSYYVYALKDGRSDPAGPFYIGKGTGIRAWEHELQVDDSAKGTRIREIHDSGSKVLVTKLVDGLTEVEALRVEAELIVAFGTISTGGPLTKCRNSKTDKHQGKSAKSCRAFCRSGACSNRPATDKRSCAGIGHCK